MIELSKLIYYLKDKYNFSITINNLNDTQICVTFFDKLNYDVCDELTSIIL